MSEVFDYENWVIHFQGKSYPFRTINVDDDGFSYTSIVSTHDLNHAIYDEHCQYPSTEAQWIDEQIIYYVTDKDELELSDEEILKMIYA